MQAPYQISEKFKEKDLEEIIATYPEIIEPQLNLIGRQVSVYGRRIDLLFRDAHERQLIIELKNGPIKDEHIGQILSYEGTLLSPDRPDIRVMLVGTRVPPNIRRALDHHGIAWKELSHESIEKFLLSQKNHRWDNYFREEIIKKNSNNSQAINSYLYQKKQTGLSTNVVKTAGIKIYKGASSTLHNVEVSLKKPFNFSNIQIIKDVSVKNKLTQLSELNEPIYVWAALATIQKKIRHGDPIYFVLADECELYKLIYIDDVKDVDSEIQRYVGWVGKGFNKVVFMNKRIRKNITSQQVNEIISLLKATYRETGMAGYIYEPTLNILQHKKLCQILENM